MPAIGAINALQGKILFSVVIVDIVFIEEIG